MESPILTRMMREMTRVMTRIENSMNLKGMTWVFLLNDEGDKEVTRVYAASDSDDDDFDSCENSPFPCMDDGDDDDSDKDNNKSDGDDDAKIESEMFGLEKSKAKAEPSKAACSRGKKHKWMAYNQRPKNLLVKAQGMTMQYQFRGFMRQPRKFLSKKRNTTLKSLTTSRVMKMMSKS
ncbi:hypothetical protein CRG98_026029 [Punica granatum]|uniref:Uncharacterized protein n=1 Tax=Punica granatum TaxID=22663 RepID=A0A2I0JBE6_PUNGR|nr:hypothetical protein CRG98_026029 [Punica granatum]